MNLHSSLGSHKVLSMVLYSDWFIVVQVWLLSFCHSFILKRSHLLLDQLPGSLHICHLILGSASLYLPSEPHIYSLSLTHSYLVGRGMVVGHISTVYTYDLICTKHIDMIARLDNKLGSTLVRLLSHMCQYYP